MAACSRPAGYAGSTPVQSLRPCQGNEQVLILLVKGTLVYSHSFWRALGVLQLAITTTVRHKLASLLLRQVYCCAPIGCTEPKHPREITFTEAEP
ncbi:hypothetical protein F5144DRAFT_618840 [Chaetomium tenue]|uniref:Uncharacterized protein n=1 Tax=Chaetomium tenue TaxID=1854479 RepID=A0ACB7PJQ6_9PEZI|nr:hypothetical protein F5144DRAFT_618840 [Chaetomium globosum]